MARPQEFDTNEALHQAMDVFWQKGYEATSLSDLLKVMGLSKSSLYAAFGGKRDLFVAAFDAYRKERVVEMRQILGQPNAREAITQFFRKIVNDTGNASSLGCMSINQAVEMAPRDPEVRSRVLEDFQLMEDALTATIEHGQSNGSITSNEDPRQLACALVLAFPGLQVMTRAGADQKRLDEALNRLLASLD